MKIVAVFALVMLMAAVASCFSFSDTTFSSSSNNTSHSPDSTITTLAYVTDDASVFALPFNFSFPLLAFFMYLFV